jgi:tetratricopeptide (TPR) repeat protein
MFEKAESLNRGYVNLTQDTLNYYLANYWLNSFNHNLENQHFWLTRAYAYDSTDADVLSFLAESYIEMGNFDEGLKFFKQSYEIDQANDRIPINRLHRMAYAFAKAGQIEEADYYFDRAEKICKSIIHLNRPYAQFGWSQLDLAMIYAFRGEKEKAMGILRDLHQRSPTPFIAAMYMPWDPMLDGLRDDPEFQQLTNDFGKRYQAEIERVRQWLEENDML